MGFLRRGNYAANTVGQVVDSVRYTIRQNAENQQFANHTPEESAALAKRSLELTAMRMLILEGQCYVGITADPVQSLNAHGVDIFAENTFFCMDIPKEQAADCKKAVMDLEGYEAVSDPQNDRTETPYAMLYLYIYKISDQTNEHPDLTGLTARESMPDREIAVRFGLTDGKCNTQYYIEMNENVCDQLTAELFNAIAAGKLAALSVRHRDCSRIMAEFGEGCCIISYDSGTSQCGGYQSYRSGETSRKKVQLYTGEYPEYMLCRDMDILKAIIQYYLLKGRKPTKRQNVKWVNMKLPGWE